LHFSLPGQVASLGAPVAETNRMLASLDRDIVSLMIPEAWAALTPGGIASVSLSISNKATGAIVKADVFNATPGQQVSRTYNIPVGALYTLVIRAFSGPLGSGTQVYAGTSQINLNTATAGVAVPVAVNMIPVINVPPVPTAAAITSTGAAASSQVMPNDPNINDIHSYALTTQPTNGTATVSSTGLVSYTPNIGFTGTDSLTVTVTDQGGLTGTVAIAVTAIFTRQATGSVKDNNNVALAGVSITFDSNGRTVVATTTDNTGVYAVVLSPATYTINASKAGYVSSSATFTLTVSGSNVAPAIVLVAGGGGAGAISGTVKSATTNTGLSGATINLRQGINAPNSATVVATATSGAGGAYSLSGLAAGTYTATVSLNGYANESETIVVSGGQTTAANPLLMSPLLSAGQVRIVLSWGATPGDLDSHLVGPVSGAATGPRQFHVNYSNTGSQSASPFAQLDLDVTSGFGPETITIAQRFSGTYRYYVHDFSNGGSTASTVLTGSSSAIVEVYVGAATAPSVTFNVPVSGAGDMWHVFDMDGATGAITPANTIGMANTEPAVVSVTPASSMVAIGGTTQLSASLERVDQSTTAFVAAWSSSATGISTISPAGLVTGVAPGNAQITATESMYGYSAISKADVFRFVVNATTDTVDINASDGICLDANSKCSLRAAIQESNALAGADSIGLPAGTYTLSIAGAGENLSATGDLDVSEALSITGVAAGSTIIQGGVSLAASIDRVFSISGAATFDLSALTIRNGKAATDGGGGGILMSGGTLNITDSVISGNSAPPTAGTNVGNGGGIYCSFCTLNLTRSTVSGNAAQGTAWGVGGGILKTGSGNVSIINSTISGNSASFYGGGMNVNGGTVNILNSTITANTGSVGGGGLYLKFLNNAATYNLQNTIIASQTGGVDCASDNGGNAFPFSAGADVISSDGTCTGATTANPLLGVLSNNGGTTQTHALGSGSPAINAGNNAVCPATDQRGVARSDGSCDIGAYEF